MPRYSFLLARLAGISVRQGLRQGATLDSSCSMMDSVTTSYADGICVLLLSVWISFDGMGSTNRLIFEILHNLLTIGDRIEVLQVGVIEGREVVVLPVGCDGADDLIQI